VKIRDHIIKRKLFGLFGGSDAGIAEKRELLKTNINTILKDGGDKFLTKNDMGAIKDNMVLNMQGLNGLLINEKDPAFTALIEADNKLVEEFGKFQDLSSEAYTGLAKGAEVKKELLKIQKSLFNLQVKIIFSQLRKIKTADITPILAAVTKKVEAMNSYIERQEALLNDENTPVASSSASSKSPALPQQAEKKSFFSLNPLASSFKPTSTPASAPASTPAAPASPTSTPAAPASTPAAPASTPAAPASTPKTEEEITKIFNEWNVKPSLAPEPIDEKDKEYLKNKLGNDLYKKGLAAADTNENAFNKSDISNLKEELIVLVK
jgi:hypothetical protein